MLNTEFDIAVSTEDSFKIASLYEQRDSRWITGATVDHRRIGPDPPALGRHLDGCISDCALTHPSLAKHVIDLFPL